MKEDLLKGPWPSRGANEEELRQIWQGLLKGENGNVCWKKTPVLGFPSMSPHKLGSRVFKIFQTQHTNAILTHTRGKGEKGFEGISTLERAVIRMTGGLLGASEEVDGYITSGGTEANIMGLWVGREKLRTEIKDPNDERVSVLCSAFTHYSINKACSILGLGEGKWGPGAGYDSLKDKECCSHFIPAEDGSGLQIIKCHNNGAINLKALSEKIQYLLEEKGIKRFIILSNEGTTMTGAMDDTKQIAEIAEMFESSHNHEVGFYIHVDAAYGGFVYPFLDPDGQWAFRVPRVDSVTVDPYKMGQAPLAQGIFMCRKDFQKYIQRTTGYVNDQYDDTLIGSRSGANAAAFWAIICSEGFEGFEKMHKESLVKAKYLESKLQNLGYDTIQELNMVAFTLPDSLTPQTLQKFDDMVIHPFHLMWNLVNMDPENIESKPVRMVKFNITRDVQIKWIDDFLTKFTEALS